jgi:hypothetical protein
VTDRELDGAEDALPVLEDELHAAEPSTNGQSGGGRSMASCAAVAWIVVVATGAWLGRVLRDRGVHIVMPTPPVLGRSGGASAFGLIGAATLGIALTAVLPVLAARLPWRRLLVAVALASVAWWVGLALAEGTSGLVRGPSWPTEYLHDVPTVRADPGGFLRGFANEIDRYEIHVRGHPPGMVLVLAGLDAIGLGGPRWEAALVLAVSATAPIAVLSTLRDVAGETTARLAAPFLALAPAAIWIATSADALYMTIAAWSVAAVVSASSRNGPRSVALAVAGGGVGAAALLGSYGMVLVAAIPAVTVWQRRRFDVALTAAASAVVALVALLPLGYSWLAGLAATRHEYEVLDLDRPYAAFLLINLSAWFLALGPATLAGAVSLRDRGSLALVGGGIAAAMSANLSGLSEGEVERIWLPFGLWVLPAGIAVARSRRATRFWLLAQVATALVVVGTVRTQW